MKNNIASKQNIDSKKIIVITPKVENFDIEPVIRPDKLKTIGFINKGERKGSSIIRKLATQNPNWKFVVFGQNLLENDKTTLENVDNRGFENLEKVIYNSVDIFLVPSEWDEPFGRVPVEALLHECPVLVSSKGGLPESVFNETKLIVKDGSIVEWEKEINDVFLNYAKYIKLCHKLQQKIGKRNSKSDFNLIKAFEKL
ncbi:glycosyltransferase [Amylibacter sp.]|nr:glycosyltransferase [Amylibacter sp.]